MSKKYETSIIIDAQAKGFADVEKQGVKFEQTIGRIGKTFAGTGVEVKKYADSIIKEFGAMSRVSLKDVRKQIDGLQDELSGVYKEQEAVNTVMSEMSDKAGPAYGKLEEHSKKLAEESRVLERRVQLLTKAYSQEFKEAEKAARETKRLADEQAALQKQMRGAFIQGLAQGGLPFPAPFLQRGPGMGRQVAGMAIGRAVMGGVGAGRAVGGAMFGGVQGLAQGLGAIPLVGGALAGQFTRAAGYAQQAIQLQQQRLGLLPHMVSPEEALAHREAQLARVGRNSQVRAAEERRLKQEQIYNDLLVQQETFKQRRQSRYETELDQGKLAAAAARGTNALAMERARQEGEQKARRIGELARTITGVPEKTDAQLYAEGVKFVEPAEGAAGPGGVLLAEQQMGSGRLTKAMRTQARNIERARLKLDKLTASVEQARTRALRGVRGPSPFADFGALGTELMGVARPEAEQFFGTMIGAGGGFRRGAQQQNMLSISAAARTVFGLGPEVSGAFLQAGRRGGVAGMQGTGGRMYREALSDAMKSGLEGSELNTWMQQVAQGIQNFQNTGIPINPKSITAMAGDISRAGITGTRAMNIAQGITGRLQQIGRQGPQGGLDLYLLQTLGGYRGGGSREYVESRIRLEKMSKKLETGGVGAAMGEGDLKKALQGLVTGGASTHERAALLQGLLGNVGMEESLMLTRYFRGEMTPEQKAKVEKEYGVAPGKEGYRTRGEAREAAIYGAGGFEAVAGKTVKAFAGHAQTMAALNNKQIAIGNQIAGTITKLESMAASTTSEFVKLSKNTLPDVVSGLETLQKTAISVAEAIATGDWSKVSEVMAEIGVSMMP